MKPSGLSHKELQDIARGHPPDAAQDEAMASLMKGLNMLIAQASASRLGTAVQILHSAKEEMVHWAVTMNFHESAKDHFINQHLYDSGLLALGEFLSRVSTLEDAATKSTILKLLGSAMMTPPTGIPAAPRNTDK